MFRMDRITGAKIFYSDQSDKRGLEGEAIVPGFSMSVAELFEEWDF